MNGEDWGQIISHTTFYVERHLCLTNILLSVTREIDVSGKLHTDFEVL